MPWAQRKALEQAIQNVAACANWEAAPGAEGLGASGLVRVDVVQPQASAADSNVQVMVPAGNVMLFIDDIEVARTDSRGLAEFRYPVGSYVLHAIGFPYFGGPGETISVSSDRATQAHVELDSGKEIAAYSHPMVDEAQDGLLPVPLSGLHIGFVFDADGADAFIDGLTSLSVTDDVNGETYPLDEECDFQDGKIVVRRSRPFEAFLEKTPGTVTLDIYGGTTDSWPHRESVTLTYAPVDLPGPRDMSELPDLPWEVCVSYVSRRLTKYVRCDQGGCDVRALPKGLVTIHMTTAHAAFSMGLLELTGEFPIRALADAVAERLKAGGGRAEGIPQ